MEVLDGLRGDHHAGAEAAQALEQGGGLGHADSGELIGETCSAGVLAEDQP